MFLEDLADMLAGDRSKDIHRYSKKLNTSYIDVEIDFYREIYNEWDFSPFTNRDIDDDLMEFLVESAREIPRKHKICIVFHIPESLKDPEKEEKSVGGFVNYFNYELRKEKNKRFTLLRQAMSSGVYGLIFLLVGMLGGNFITASSLPSWLSIITEGMDIGGWVLIWEMFYISFYTSKEMQGKEKTLARLRDAKIAFNYR